jgi:hypothetical protein
MVGGPERAGLSGAAYMLTPVVMMLNGRIMGRRRRKLEERLRPKELDENLG